MSRIEFHHLMLLLGLTVPGCATWNAPHWTADPRLQSPAVVPDSSTTTVTPQSDPTRTNRLPSGTGTAPQQPQPASPQPTAPAQPASPAPGSDSGQNSSGTEQPIEQRTTRPPLYVPGPLTGEEAEPQTKPQAPAQLDNWQSTPESRSQGGTPSPQSNGSSPSGPSSSPATPLPPPGRNLQPSNPSGVELGEPAPFPQLPNRSPDRQAQPESTPDVSAPKLPEGPTAGMQMRGVSQSNSAVDAALLRPVDWEQRLTSTGRRPLQVARAGQGRYPVFMLGSLSGLETESVQLMDDVLRHLKTAPQLPPVDLFLLRTPNPDGIAENTRTNRNGVDLNRNFPSSRFTAAPNQLTGAFPGSEIETQHVLQLLREHAPQRVIHVRSAIGQRPLILLNQAAARRLSGWQPSAGIDVAALEGDLKAGSLEEFVTLRLNAEMMTVLLPLDGFGSLTSQQLLELASLRIAPGSPDRADNGQVRSTHSSAGQSTEVPNSPRNDRAESSSLTTPRPDGLKGYVEILPPPPLPGTAPTQDDPRYYELPPPPVVTTRQ